MAGCSHAGMYISRSVQPGPSMPRLLLPGPGSSVILDSDLRILDSDLRILDSDLGISDTGLGSRNLGYPDSESQKSTHLASRPYLILSRF